MIVYVRCSRRIISIRTHSVCYRAETSTWDFISRSPSKTNEKRTPQIALAACPNAVFAHKRGRSFRFRNGILSSNRFLYDDPLDVRIERNRRTSYDNVRVGRVKRISQSLNCKFPRQLRNPRGGRSPPHKLRVYATWKIIYDGLFDTRFSVRYRNVANIISLSFYSCFFFILKILTFNVK